MLKIIDQVLFDKNDQPLKRLNCPKNMAARKLVIQRSIAPNCEGCSHTVLNTDYLSDEQIVDAVTRDPDVCLVIRKSNQRFEFQDE